MKRHALIICERNVDDLKLLVAASSGDDGRHNEDVALPSIIMVFVDREKRASLLLRIEQLSERLEWCDSKLQLIDATNQT